MVAFFVGLSVAVVVGLGAAFGLNAFDRGTAQAFYTSYTVPLGEKAPTDGRLAHQKGTQSGVSNAVKAR